MCGRLHEVQLRSPQALFRRARCSRAGCSSTPTGTRRSTSCGDRVRTLSLDTFGPVGVPYLTTPDAFLIGVIAGPPTISRSAPGRLYVDGLLAEIFVRGRPATYLNQPFLPAPPPPLARPATSSSSRRLGARGHLYRGPRPARRGARRRRHRDPHPAGLAAARADDRRRGAACGIDLDARSRRRPAA